MFTKKNTSLLILSFLSLFLTFTSCDSDDNDPIVIEPIDIVDSGIATPDLSILVAAIQTAGLVDALKGDGPFTVFAPTNAAFQELLDSNEAWNALSDIPTELLSAVLLYHVADSEVSSSDLSDGQMITMLNGEQIEVDLSNGVELMTVADQMVSVTNADIKASNGIIHVIDEVMLPIAKENDIIETASVVDEFSILVSAITAAGLVDALKADGPFTVFAPTNDAFQALLDSNDSWNSLNDIPADLLEQVLLYHVAVGSVTSTNLINGQEITMLNGEKIIVDLSMGVELMTIAEQMVSVTGADIMASNGIIHKINQVMLPIPPAKDIVDIAVETDNLSILVAALQKAELVDALKVDSPYTVFAPTDEAFQALLDSNNDWSSLEDIPMETLQSVLLFHVLPNKVLSTDLSDTYVKTLATGPNDENLSLQVETSGAIEFNGDSSPVDVDIEASNGVIHIIDKVMLPPSIVNLALNNAGFTYLVAALTDSRHTTEFVSILSGNGPFTVFAPTNDAFQILLDSNNNWNSIGDIPIETLDAVLKYHVVNEANVQADQLSNGDIPTLGGIITIDLSNGAQIKTTSNQTVNVLVGAAANDVQGANGVIHAIDTVLIPGS
jgi:uncharacterized surface protein with fasciclin (FAS1) repeats